MHSSLLLCLTICLASAISLGWYLWRTRSATHALSITSEIVKPACLPLKQYQIAAQNAETLLQHSGLAENIQSNSGLAPANFEHDMYPVIVRVAEFVQRFPAS